MILDDLKELKTGRSELRKFGLLVGGVFAGLGLLFLLRHKAHAPYFLVPGLLLVALGAIAPALLKHIYRAWMTLAILLGFVVSHIILTLFFFLVITPIGLIARMAGKDFLSLKLDRSTASYWVPREKHGPKTPAEYERQF